MNRKSSNSYKPPLNNVSIVNNVSVVIPVFNRRDLITEAIDSALAQESETLEVEVIVVDDSSTDDTLAVIGARYGNDPRIRIIANKRAKGPAGARNTGIFAARFEILAFLDSDDIYLPGHLAEALEVFAKYPQVGLVFGRILCEQNGVELPLATTIFENAILHAPKIIEDEAVIIFGTDFFKHLLEAGCYFALCSVVMLSEAAHELMAETLGSSEDYEFWVRMSRKLVFACLKELQVCVRRNGDNLSSADPERVGNNHLQACRLMLAYPDLLPVERRLIYQRMAKTNFSLAWYYKQNGCLMKALRRNFQSMRFGWIWPNLLAVVKLPIHYLIKRKAM